MHHGTYPNSTHAQAPPPGQDSTSSGSGEVNNAVNDVPLSGRLDFQVMAYPAAPYVCLPSFQGEQYDFFQQGPQFFRTPHALVSQIVSIQTGYLLSWRSVVQRLISFFIAECFSALTGDLCTPRKSQSGLWRHPITRDCPQQCHGYQFLGE
jgi:hypothetical protein